MYLDFALYPILYTGYYKVNISDKSITGWSLYRNIYNISIYHHCFGCNLELDIAGYTLISWEEKSEVERLIKRCFSDINVLKKLIITLSYIRKNGFKFNYIQNFWLNNPRGWEDMLNICKKNNPIYEIKNIEIKHKLGY